MIRVLQAQLFIELGFFRTFGPEYFSGGSWRTIGLDVEKVPLQPDLDYSLHDAWIESVVIGLRREVALSLALGSARISDPRLPDGAVLRIGGIENFEQIRAFFIRLGPEPIARIDRVEVAPEPGSSSTIKLELDPQGTVAVVCTKLVFTTVDPGEYA